MRTNGQMTILAQPDRSARLQGGTSTPHPAQPNALTITQTGLATRSILVVLALATSSSWSHAAEQAPADTVVRGGSMKFRVAIPQALGRRVLKIRATSPDGKSARWFERSLIVRDGRGELDLPVAWNETAGKWTITATDLFTTRTTKSTVRIK